MILSYFIFNIFCIVSSELHNSPIRQTIYGKIRGKVTARIAGTKVEEYLGVPYASPPIENLRFKPPQKPLVWKPDILDTTMIPPACRQHNLKYVNMHKPNFHRASEDCLYMNIYVPNVNSKLLPVLVFIHGGSSVNGMGAMFDGDVLASFGEIIVITFNYRLNIFGLYVDNSEGVDGNYGLLDQVRALEWIHENIHFFNGDQSKVTIHGHSSGAGDAGLHLMSNLSRGLFRYAIIHSGSPFADWYMSECVNSTRTKQVHAKCIDGTHGISNKFMTKMKELMKNGSYDDILSAYLHDFDSGVENIRVLIDGHFIQDIPFIHFKCHAINVDSVLFVSTRDESFPEMVKIGGVWKNIDYVIQRYKHLFEDRPAFEDDVRKIFVELGSGNNRSSGSQISSMMADVELYVPWLRLADLISDRMQQIYLLSFEYISQKHSGPDWLGIPHGWDLFYVFGAPLVGHPIHAYTLQDAEVSKTTMSLISNYVKYGYLTLDGNHTFWTYNSSMRNYNKLDKENNKETSITQEINFRSKRIDFWNSYLFAYEHQFTCSRSICLTNSLKLLLFCLFIVLYTLLNV